MRRNLALGAWYVLLFAAAIVAEQRLVASKEAEVVSEPGLAGEKVDTVRSGDHVETLGEESEGYIKVRTAGGKTGWIVNSDLYSTKEEEALTKTSGAGAGADKGVQEGAYVKGFDPEVEGQMRADNPSLSKVYEEEVLPWIWETRGSQKLEEAEEHLELLLMQNKKDTPEAAETRKRIAELQAQVQPLRDKWQADLRAFRQAGKIGEFAGRK